jgi:amino-acid N-acetyltransferase
VGASLTECAIDQACARSVAKLFLLTTDAAPFFERFDFQYAQRAEAPIEIQMTREFRELCPASACFMKLALASSSTDR